MATSPVNAPPINTTKSIFPVFKMFAPIPITTNINGIYLLVINGREVLII